MRVFYRAVLGNGLFPRKLAEAQEHVQRAYADERVYDARRRRHVAEDRRDEVEIEDADQAPVQASDNDQHERDPVKSGEFVHGVLVYEK